MSVTTRTNIESTICEVCRALQGKYRCPGCQKVTCSLTCSKEHKKVNDCTGKEDRSKFVERKNFESVMVSDFRLLENLENNLDRMGRANRDFGQLKYTPRFLQILAREARKRGIHFLPMSNVFQRHKLNKSFYVVSSKWIEWTVEWAFDMGDHIEKLYHHKVLEHSTIKEAIQALFVSNQPQSKLLEVREFKRSTESEFRVFFYHVKNCKGMSNRFTPVDLSTQLKDALYGKTVVEFPTFYVVLRRDWPKYETAEQSKAEPQEQQQPPQSSPQQPPNEDLECFLENKECLS